MSFLLSDPITVLSGVGPARAKSFEKLGITTIGDLLSWYPRDYEDRRTTVTIQSAEPGTSVCIPAMVASQPRLARLRAGLELLKVKAVDDTGVLELTFFNQGYLKNSLSVGKTYVFYGKVEQSGGRKSMTNPVFEREDAAGQITGAIVPIYPLTAGISNKQLSGSVRRALAQGVRFPEDPLPEKIRRLYGLMDAEVACRWIHCPSDMEQVEAARRRLIFEELFFLSVGLCRLKSRRSTSAAPKITGDLSEYLKLLPFPLTGAQRRAAQECAADLARGIPMNRLVQGDVGSGKTVVAAAAVYLTALSGYQSAFMAPTEILAEQHYRTLSTLLEPAHIRVALLTGSTRAKEKRDILERLQLGMIDLLIGTHALITDAVEFRRLGLVITDEQHRFGVRQRAALASKSQDWHPHVLVMSATPIPRTLALLIYGDLDVSIIDELPPGRQPVDTFRVHSDKRQRMYGFVRKQVEEGHQVYIVCPAVEEAAPDTPWEAPGGLELKSVTEYCRELQTKIFPDLRVDFVHGKMKPAEKERVMASFAAGNLDILVATTVIEVGVDVPNANLMIVENAERFGLSQLHQLRGRVGRGSAKSYCVLVSDASNEEAVQRLKVLCSSNDGFKISEEDLKLRGPGDFFGARQHGLPQLKVADLAGDTRVLKDAQEAARQLLAQDPELADPRHLPIRQKVLTLFDENPDIFN